MSTLLRDLIDSPERAGDEDYVLRLTDAVAGDDRLDATCAPLVVGLAELQPWVSHYRGRPGAPDEQADGPGVAWSTRTSVPIRCPMNPLVVISGWWSTPDRRGERALLRLALFDKLVVHV